MTMAVRVEIEPLQYEDGSRAEADVFAVAGQNKKREALAHLDKNNPKWEGHIWKGRDLVIEEVIIPAPKPKNIEE
jgi:hypothetical protein